MAAIRNTIRFVLNERDVTVGEVGASDTLLDYLRLEQRLTGTKEGCAEGDCGACTVLVGHLADGDLRYETVNACIRLLASVDGCHVVTVEHLAAADGTLHPVQQALVDHHGSQCGFCTPGFVMSLYALWMQNPDPDDDAIETALQGNLCRCTGYEPIVVAAKAAASKGGQAGDVLIAERQRLTERLTALADGSRVDVARGADRAILPADADDLAEVLEANPQATIVAGSTDVGLWITKFMRDISPAVFVGHLDELARITRDGDDMVIGAGVTYTQAQDAITEAYPHLTEFWNRIGGWQVRNMGTIGGNVANGSPIGDTPPILISLGARVVLRKGSSRREVPMEDFFIAYGKQDREPGDFVEAIRLPLKMPAGTNLAAYKISKRRDEDISSVCGGFAVQVEDGVVTAARLAFGGMAATPKRASQAEQALVGKPWSADTATAAAAALSDDFQPISDWRASADYRAAAAHNLLVRFHMEHSGSPQPVRLTV